MKIKSIVIVSVIIVAFVGYYFATRVDVETNPEPQQITVNGIPTVQAEGIKITEESKSNVYNKELDREKREAEKLRHDTSVSVAPVAAAVNNVFTGSYEKKLDEVKEKRSKLIPVYNGKAYPSGETRNSLDASNRSENVTGKSNTKSGTQNPKISYSAASLSSLSDRKPAGQKAILDSSNKAQTKKKRAHRKSYNNEDITAEDPLPSNKVVQQNKKNDAAENNVILASVYGDQTIKNGSSVRFRILQETTIKGIHYPRNTIFNGKALFAQDRLFVKVTRLPDETGNNFVTVNLDLHDTDLQEGINAPIDLTRDAAGQQLTNGGINMLSTSMSTAGVVANGAGQILRQATSSGSQKIFIHDGDPVQFMETLKK